jgi:hypothetical protein
MNLKRIILHGHRPPGAAVAPALAPLAANPRIFLISPANLSGTRAQRLIAGRSKSELARRLNVTGVPLEEVFSAMSTLYFRGKLDYARKFSNPPTGLPAVLIITPSRGLMLPNSKVTLADMVEISVVRALHTNPHFRDPLERDARLLSERLGSVGDVVLLGSIATLKYIDPLIAVFGSRLVFPREFLGRGNMSRGSLLFRCCRENRELRYSPVADVLHLVSRRRARKSVIDD